ncbi:nuclear transport factor 2 family protein [Thalassotalea atypica]|uniref:nuclear transport factor 2 family protein n=1 Tax=Thalassotalea atypica TaxID=2054316 RepID=UPI0025742B17|nr:nuclear transport factor 2 family protein [Thalassotalea atypica]
MALYFKKLGLLIVILCLTAKAFAGSPEKQISDVLQLYINGTANTKPDQITKAFYPDADLLLTKAESPVWRVSAKEYISWYSKAKAGTATGRQGNILNIDVTGDIATAKVEIFNPSKKQYFIDLFLLRKVDKHWQIISKTASQLFKDKNNHKILFIVSNAHFHGNSSLPTGVSYSEIVNAYHTFMQAGYTVEFVSPEGGAIPLAYINTSDELAKQYLYNADFMYAIKHTMSPEQITASQYKAVHYVGGGNAMYGVANNAKIQAITMEIYEKHQGVISSVCHGTAGIVFLKKSNGEYLVSGKKISGYPDEYENQSKAYFKQFPFKITETIEHHGGTFHYSPRNKKHVEVDGRIVTGQNYLSSASVAQEIINIIEAQVTVNQ